jgi:membrane protein YdbS with pleckstrin-like domain
MIPYIISSLIAPVSKLMEDLEETLEYIHELNIKDQSKLLLFAIISLFLIYSGAYISSKIGVIMMIFGFIISSFIAPATWLVYVYNQFSIRKNAIFARKKNWLIDKEPLWF